MTKKVLVLGAVVTVVVALLLSGALDGLRDRDQVEELFTDSGPWGPLLFISLFVVAQPLSLPGAALIIPATFVWPWYEVAIYSLVGGLIASTLGFTFARWLARDWVQPRIPMRLRSWDARLERNGLAATVVLRVITGYAPAADWVLGVSKVRWTPFLVGTAVGLVPTTLLFAIWGDDAARGLRDAPPWFWLVLAVVIAVTVVVVRRRSRR